MTMTSDKLFDAAAACALWNSGDRVDLELKPICYRLDLEPSHCFLILKHTAFYGSTHRIITVKLNPDGTIEPAPETWGR
jgi:hypothetical protein